MDIEEGRNMMRNTDYELRSWNMYYDDDTLFIDVEMVPVESAHFIEFTIEAQWFFDIRFLVEGI